MPRILPASWMPDCQPVGIVTHWTAGAHRASELDLEHYHFVIEGGGRVLRGEHSIADNMDTSDGDYAAHTGRLNSKRIGIAVCCSAGAVETPYRPGTVPMTRLQWDNMVLVAADCAERYRIPVDRKTIAGHGLVYTHNGMANPTGKWDPLKLPWAPELSKLEVDNLFRKQVAEALNGTHLVVPPSELPVTAQWNGKPFSSNAYMDRGHVWVPVRSFCEASRFQIMDVRTSGTVNSVVVRDPYAPMGVDHQLELKVSGNVGYVRVKDLREALGLQTTWDKATRTVNIIGA